MCGSHLEGVDGEMDGNEKSQDDSVNRGVPGAFQEDCFGEEKLDPIGIDAPRNPHEYSRIGDLGDFDIS
jgi:hypothetical protein